MGYWQIKVAKLTALAGASAGLIWFLWPAEKGWQFAWWPFWTVLSGYAAFGFFEWREAVRVAKIQGIDSMLLQHDVDLISTFRALLPSDGEGMRFFSGHDLGNSFGSGALSDAEKFSDEWKDPERRFHDSELEALKESLRQEISRFLDEIALKVGPAVGSGKLSVIPPDHMSDIDIPQRFMDAISKLNGMAREISIKHGKLMSMCNEKVATREKVLTINSIGL